MLPAPTVSDRARRWVEALLVCFALGACGNYPGSMQSASQTQEAIYGGDSVAEGEWENVVALWDCTGVLVAPSLVLYAAHCGTSVSSVLVGTDIRTPRRSVRVSACRSHPDAALGNGRDVAYCVLAEPILNVPALELLDDEEAETVFVGMPVTQIGYGIDENGGAFGIKRRTTGTIESLGDDFIVTGVEGGTCSGDSGGPALVKLDRPGDSEPVDWHLLGLLSAGTSYDCEITTDHYTDVRAVRAWIESESGVDLSRATLATHPGEYASASGCAVSPERHGRPFSFGFTAVAAALAALSARRAAAARRRDHRRT